MIQFPGAQPSLRSLAAAQRGLNRTSARLAAGKRIATAADDPSGLGIVERLRAQEAAQTRGLFNLGDGQNVLATADGGLQRVGELTGRMRELSVRAGNGSLTDADRDLIQLEYDQLGEEVTRIAESTRFNTKNLLNGDLSGSGALTIDDGTGEPIEVQIGDHTSSGLGTTGLRVGDTATLTALDAALTQVSDTRSAIGAQQNRLASRVADLRGHSVRLAASRARIEDADFAAETSNRSRDLVRLRAALALRLRQFG